VALRLYIEGGALHASTRPPGTVTRRMLTQVDYFAYCLASTGGGRLPVVGVDGARSLLDQSIRLNGLLQRSTGREGKL